MLNLTSEATVWREQRVVLLGGLQRGIRRTVDPKSKADKTPVSDLAPVRGLLLVLGLGQDRATEWDALPAFVTKPRAR